MGSLGFSVEVLVAILILAALGAFVAAPLRSREHSEAGGGDAASPELADLEALKEAKYRQIRDAELDREQGKLSAEDWKRADAELRREAVDILKRIDAGRSRRRLS